ncbi:MAG: HAMP domain-containing sensor histidine kinase, partial [Chloroflexota bacterium]
SGRAVRKMLGLVDSLLDIAKLENGVMKLEREPVLFPSVCRAVIEEYAPLAEDLAIHLRADLRAGLPALYVDEEKVERVLLNLVDNATKFTPAEGYIIVRAAPLPAGEGAEPMVQITVEDNGPGIPDEDKERLFNRFTQLETRQGRRRGTGLGLAFCRLAVEAHGGRIWIEDAPDGGARFVFTLPAVNIPEWELSDDWEAEAE